MKNFVIIMILFFFASCGTLGVPTMERKVKVWNGSPEEIGICRLSSLTLKNDLQIPWPTRAVKKFHQGFIGRECMSASDPEFQKYGCLTFDDIGVIYGYIETLINSCKEWKKTN